MITISPLFRVPFIVIAVGLHHHVLSPRSWSRRPIEGFQQKNESISEKTIFSNVAISTGLQQLIVTGLGLAEIIAIVQHRHYDAQHGLHAPFFIGTGLVMAGACIRVWCFRAMGTMFTFETGVQDDHRLVVDGPYAFVRHPSYIGAYLMLTGLFVWQSDDGSWMRESGALQTWIGKGFIAFCTAFALSKVVAFLSRTKAEDRMLEGHFGDVWRAWASSVPYRLIPYVY